MAMSRSACVDGIIFVFPPVVCESESARIRDLARKDNLGLMWRVAEGGEKRQDSSRRGFLALPKDCARVLVHDAARCLVGAQLIRAVAEKISAETPAIVPAIAVTDTIKIVCPEKPELAEASLPRERLRAVQTPQGFFAPILREAYAKLGHDPISATDDAMLLESLAYPVLLVPGSETNIKITNPSDLMLLKANPTPLPCSGLGYDVHRFGKGRPLKLGGVAIPGNYEVIAHSDGDVLLHSVIDALLGCATLGDIGSHFPDNDPRYDGISSALLLDHTLALLDNANVKICHVDMTVVTQKPRLAPYAEEIRYNVARLLGLAKNAVNFKATTEEGMGFTGIGEGIKAYALANGLKG